MDWKGLGCNEYRRVLRLIPVDPFRRLVRSELTGQHVTVWPLMAARASQELGNVRHALSQRVVAGVHTSAHGPPPTDFLGGRRGSDGQKTWQGVLGPDRSELSPPHSQGEIRCGANGQPLAQFDLEDDPLAALAEKSEHLKQSREF